MAETRAQLNRKVRQDSLREQLSKQGHIQQALELVKKLCELKKDLSPNQVTRLSKAIDTHLKLVNKYLPDLKATEITGGNGEPFTVEVVEYLSGE